MGAQCVAREGETRPFYPQRTQPFVHCHITDWLVARWSATSLEVGRAMGRTRWWPLPIDLVPYTQGKRQSNSAAGRGIGRNRPSVVRVLGGLSWLELGGGGSIGGCARPRGSIELSDLCAAEGLDLDQGA